MPQNKVRPVLGQRCLTIVGALLLFVAEGAVLLTGVATSFLAALSAVGAIATGLSFAGLPTWLRAGLAITGSAVLALGGWLDLVGPR